MINATLLPCKRNRQKAPNVGDKYLLLTECEGRTGRISARGLGSTDRAASARSVQKRPRADILPVRPERTRSIRYLLLDF